MTTATTTLSQLAGLEMQFEYTKGDEDNA